MVIPKINSSHGSDTRNVLNRAIDVINLHGKSMQDLVAKGQLTPTQYANLIETVNGLISKGDVKPDDLSPQLLELINNSDGTPFEILSIPRDGSVTPVKTSFMKKTRNLFDGTYRNGALSVNAGNMTLNNTYGNANVSNLTVIPIELGVTYTVKVHDSHDVLRIAVNNTEPIYTGNNNMLSENLLNSRSSSEHTFTNTSTGKFLLVQTSESNQKPRLQVEKGGVPTDYVEGFEVPKEFVHGLSDVIDITSELDGMFPKINYSQGSINSDGEDVKDNALTRVHSEWLDLEIGDTIEIVDKSYHIAIAGLPTTFTWRDNDYTHQQTEPIRFMVKKNNENNITPKEAEDAIKLVTANSLVRKSDVAKVVNESSNLNITKYVTLNGNDSNTGDSVSDAYATLQKAVDEGAATVYMERGIYKQNFNAQVDELTILPIDVKGSTDPSAQPLQPIEFLGADKLTNWQDFEGIYRHSINKEYPNYKEYFIDKTIAKETGGNRPQYNCILWESKDLEMDYVMEPVLSIEDVKSGSGTFYYDGNYIYINPKNITNDFYVPFISKGLDFSGIKKLHIEDLRADYFLREPIDVDSIVSLNLKNVSANHAGYTDGFSADYTNGKFINCKAYKNRNDGFNLHFYGDTEFINCYGVNNYDDGISHHEHCTGVVIGGVFSGNVKAGSAPVQGAKINHYNVIFEGNDYGILNSRAGDGNISSGNLFKGNRFGISSNNSGTMTSFNDKFIENSNDITTNGVVNQY